MAAPGVEAVARFAETGELPEPTEGKEFFDTGVGLVTAAPMDGMAQLLVEDGMRLCRA